MIKETNEKKSIKLNTQNGSKLKILRMTIKINFPFMLNGMSPVRNLFIDTFLKGLAFLSVRGASFSWLWTVVSEMNPLLVVTIKGQTESVVKGWNLGSWCQYVFLLVLCRLVVVFGRGWIR